MDSSSVSEENGDSEERARKLEHLWRGYTTAGHQDKHWKLDSFLLEFLRIHDEVQGKGSQTADFWDMHIVSNMLYREFQTMILLMCEECDELSLVRQLCRGRGLMLLQTLCILVDKITGHSKEFANLLITLLPVLLKVPLESFDYLKGLDLISSDWEGQHHDGKGTTFLSSHVKETIRNHCKVYTSSTQRATPRSSSSPRKRSQPPWQRNDAKGKSDHEGPPASTDTTEDSDAFTSVTSLTSEECGEVLFDDRNTSRGSGEIVDKSLPRFSSEEIVPGASETPECPRAGQSTAGSLLSSLNDLQPSISGFDLLLLILSVLENLTGSQRSIHDAALLMHCSGQLINVAYVLGSATSKASHSAEEIFCEWGASAVAAAQWMMLRTVYAVLYKACRSPKSAKQLARSSYIRKVLEVIQNALGKEDSVQRFEILPTAVKASSDKESRDVFSNRELCAEFYQLLCLASSLDGLMSFLVGCLHYGILVNSSLLMLSEELYQQFATNDGVSLVQKLVLRLEELSTLATETVGAIPSEDPGDAHRRLETSPSKAITRVLSTIAKIVMLLKKGKRHCRTSSEHDRKKTGSLHPPCLSEEVASDLCTSDVGESSESTGDMEAESERRRVASVLLGPEGLCSVCKPLMTLLHIFKESQTELVQTRVLGCLAKVGLCHCVTADALITPLMTRFTDVCKSVQKLILNVINQLVLSEMDKGPSVCTPLQQHHPGPEQGGRGKQSSSKSPSDSGFSTNELGIADFPRGTFQERDRNSSPSWNCLSLYCARITAPDSHSALEVTKALRPLVHCGSRHLREELFRLVIFPTILRYEGGSHETYTFQSFEHSLGRTRAVTVPFPSWGTRQYGVSSPGANAKEEHARKSGAVGTGVSLEVLKACIGFLTLLLADESSRGLFLSCGGLNELQSLLCVEGLMELVLEVLEFLAVAENRHQHSKSGLNNSSTAPGGQAQKEKPDADFAIKTFLSLLQYTVYLLGDTNRKGPETELLAATQEFSLCVRVWQACLRLLSGNAFFRQSFVADGGPAYSYKLLQSLLEFFACESRTSGHHEDGESEALQNLMASLMESVLPVCLRLAHTRFWQENESLPCLDVLMHVVEQTAQRSSSFRTSFRKETCDSLMRASVQQFPAANSEQEKPQREATFCKENSEEYEDWSPVVDDEDDDGPNGVSARARTPDEGYDADREAESASDDNQGPVKGGVGHERRGRKTRENFPKAGKCMRGLIVYPLICKFIFRLLNAVFGERPFVSGSNKMVVMGHAVKCLLDLVQNCKENCKILCQEGLGGTLLECFKDSFAESVEALQGLQSVVLDVFVCLAGHSITADELRNFLALFKMSSPAVASLSEALAAVAMEAASHPGPAFTFPFPCIARNADDRGKLGSRRRNLQKEKPKKRSSRSQPSDGDASSEDAPTNSLPKTGQREAAPQDGDGRRPHKAAARLERAVSRTGPPRRRRRKAASVSDSVEKADADVVSYQSSEDFTDLPSPFSVHAVRLDLRHQFVWSARRFGVAFWVRLSSASHSVGCDLSPDGPIARSGDFSPEVEFDCEVVLHLLSLGSGKNWIEVWLMPSCGTLTFRWRNKSGANRSAILREVSTRVPALKRGRWHHVAVSLTPSRLPATETGKRPDSTVSTQVLTVIDGTERVEFETTLPLYAHGKLKLGTLLLGHVINSATQPPDACATVRDGYDLGNLMMFTRPLVKSTDSAQSSDRAGPSHLLGLNEAFYLHSLGPNCCSVGQLRTEFELVSRDRAGGGKPFVERAKLWSRLSITEQSVVANLTPGLLTSPHIVAPDLELSVKESLAVLYSPAHPLVFKQFLRGDESRAAKPAKSGLDATNAVGRFPMQLKAIRSSPVDTARTSSFLEASYDAGGMSVFIFLLAKVVETVDSERAHAHALSIVLALQRRCDFHARAMDEEAGYALVRRILLTQQCKIGYHTLKVLMEAACHGDVFKATHLSDDPIMLNIDSTAVVRNIDIFEHFLLNWRIWEKAREGVLEMLLATVEILVHSSHPHYKFNVGQFQQAQLVQRLLIGCQERQSEVNKEISSTIASLYVNIIKNIMGCPPDLTILKAVCEFLIAVHPTEDTTRLHSPARFYLSQRAFDFDAKVEMENYSCFLKRSASIPSLPVATRGPQRASPLGQGSPTRRRLAEAALSRSLDPSEGRQADKRMNRRVASSLMVKITESRKEDYGPLRPPELGGSVREPHDGTFFSPSAAQGTKPPRLLKSLSADIPRMVSASAPPGDDSPFLEGSFLLHDVGLDEPGGGEATSRSPHSPLTPQTPQPATGTPTKGSEPMLIEERTLATSRDGQSSFDPMEYDFINESDFSSLRSSAPNQSSVDEYCVLEGFLEKPADNKLYRFARSESGLFVSNSLSKMRLGLLKLLENVLFSLPAAHVPAVIGEVLKAEYLLVWAFHDSVAVRELAVKILFQYLHKAEPRVHEQFQRMCGFHQLANQLYDHRVTKVLLEGCLSLLVGRQVDLTRDSDYCSIGDKDLATTIRPLGVVPLLALMRNSLLEPGLFHLLTQHLCQLFIRVDELCLKALEHGLLETLGNLIIGLCSLQHRRRSGDRASSGICGAVEDMQLLVACIVRKACSTNGNFYFQMFEELLVSLEKMEESDHKERDLAPLVSYLARFLRYFAVQVALHFFQEVGRADGPIVNRKSRSTSFRVPFRDGLERVPVPLAPVSSWVNLSRGHLAACLNPSNLKKSPTNANFNEQTKRFQTVCQLAVAFIVYSRTFFVPEQLVAFEFHNVELVVQEQLRPGVVMASASRVGIDKEFTQFVFSFMVEILNLSLKASKHKSINKLLLLSRDVIKTQLGKLLTFMLSPEQDQDLAYFAMHLANHPEGSKLLASVLKSSAGSKFRERVCVSSLLHFPSPSRSTEEQKDVVERFKTLVVSLGLRSPLTETSVDMDKIAEEAQQWEQGDKAGMIEWQKQRADAYKPLRQRTQGLNGQIVDVALGVTKVVVEIQDTKRQALLKHSRDSLTAEVQVRKKWRQMIERLIHERSLWFDPDHSPSSWKLDPTEGPGRVRCRLQRCHLDVEEKYLMDDYRGHKPDNAGTPLAYLFEDANSSNKKNVCYIFDTPDTIRFLHHCKNITLDNKIKGVVLIGDSHVHFVGEEDIGDADMTQILLGNKDAVSLSWSYGEIQEIRARRYCLQDNAVEIFLKTGKTHLLAFDTKQDRQIVMDEFRLRNIHCFESPRQEDLVALSEKWRLGLTTNFEYLTELNKMAGRTFNDLMQYPVFPFVLRDFTSETLDLTEVKSFRDLSKPIAVQNSSKESKYKETFKWLKEEYERLGEEDPLSAPYHYGSHYSNSGTVLHFLVRLPPFTKMFLQYQDNSFDIPDRTFHSMATTWRLSSFESSTDVKELIPEFFFLPEFLENAEGFDFGVRQNGKRVMDVRLPPWAKGNRRLFILIHRQALESDFVSKHLHQWIDLVFGYKQMGPDAVEAINVFHPATYYGVDVDAVEEPVRQKALRTMIETYGQTPQQLFLTPHSPQVARKSPALPSPDSPGLNGQRARSLLSLNKFVEADVLSVASSGARKFMNSLSSDTGTLTSNASTLTDFPSPVSTVDGIRWGCYVGSPALGAPALCYTQELHVPAKLVQCVGDNRVFTLGQNSALLTVHREGADEAEDGLLWSAALCWGFLGGGLQLFSSKSDIGVPLMEHSNPDKITCCTVSVGCTLLFIGTSTGALLVLPIKFHQVPESGIQIQGTRTRLHGHTGEITCLTICHAFSIVVSGSQDHTAIIWDLNRLSFVRHLQHRSSVAAIAVSRTSGDVATVSHAADFGCEESTVEGGSELRLWTVNGKAVGSATCDLIINCLDFSNAPEGVAVNVIATGLSNGAVRLWSTWDLRHIRDIAPDVHLSPVISLSFTEDSQRLLAVNCQGKLIVWQSRNRPLGKQPFVESFPDGTSTG